MNKFNLDDIIVLTDKNVMVYVLYWNFRICCNELVNGEISLLKSIIKNSNSNSNSNSVIFDVGAAGSKFPLYSETHFFHLFDKWKINDLNNFNYNTEFVKINNHYLSDCNNDECLTIDEYCNRNNIDEIEFLKIDTDGNDLKILQGAKHMLSSIKMIQFEYDMFYKTHNVNIYDVFDLLKDWHIFRISAEGLQKITVPIENDYLYSNFFASKEYPTQIIENFEILLDSNILYRSKDEIINLYKKLYDNSTPQQFHNFDPSVVTTKLKSNIDIDSVKRNYYRIYEK